LPRPHSFWNYSYSMGPAPYSHPISLLLSISICKLSLLSIDPKQGAYVFSKDVERDTKSIRQLSDPNLPRLHIATSLLALIHLWLDFVYALC
jgi:hypothetical protein